MNLQNKKGSHMTSQGRTKRKKKKETTQVCWQENGQIGRVSYNRILFSNVKEWTTNIHSILKNILLEEKSTHRRIYSVWVHLYALWEFTKLTYGNGSQKIIAWVKEVEFDCKGTWENFLK